MFVTRKSNFSFLRHFIFELWYLYLLHNGMNSEICFIWTWRAGSECPLSLAAVDLGEDDLVLRITDLDVHADSRAGRSEPVRARIVQLNLVIAWKKNNLKSKFGHTKVWYLCMKVMELQQKAICYFLNETPISSLVNKITSLLLFWV